MIAKKDAALNANWSRRHSFKGGKSMKKVILMAVSLILVFAACSPKETPGFSLAVSDASIEQGSELNLPVSITRTGGLSDEVNLSIENAPVGLSTSFSDIATLAATADLSLKVEPSLAAGSYVLTVKGSAGALEKTAAFNLTVTAKPDTVAPTIVSISPAPDSIGVKNDENIVITFSEKMDQAATQVAFQSIDILPALVSFSWDATGTIMTLDPLINLPYTALGSEFKFKITTTARDVAGNQLIADTNSKFRTYRLQKISIKSAAAQDGHIVSNGTVFSAPTIMYIGDSISNLAARGFVGFDISSLPADLSDENIVDAKLKLFQSAVLGSPYSNLDDCSPAPCKELITEHVSYGASLNSADFDTAVLADLGNLTNSSALGWKTKTVTEAVQDDWENKISRGQRSQYRLRFPIITNGNAANDLIAITTRESVSNNPILEITYLIP